MQPRSVERIEQEPARAGQASLLRKAWGGGVAGSTACNLAIMLMGVGSGITLARSLGPQARGELATALLWPALLLLFCDLGLEFAFSFYAAKRHEDLSAIWTLALLGGLASGGVAIIIGLTLLSVAGTGWSIETRTAMRIAVTAVPAQLISGFQTYILLGRGRIAEFNAVRIVAAAAYLALIWCLAVLHAASVTRYAIAWVAAQTVTLIFSTSAVIIIFRPVLRLDVNLVPKIFRYGIKAHLSSLAAQTNLRLDQAIMSVWLPPAQLGNYVIAVAVSGVLGPLLNAFASVLVPRAASAEDPRSGAFLTSRYVKAAAILSMPVILAWIFLLPFAIPLLFGARFRDSIVPAQILTAAGLFQGQNAMLGSSLRGLGRPASPAISEGVGVVATLILLAVLLPVLAATGAAIASLVAYMIVLVLQVLFLADTAGLRVAVLARAPMGPVWSSLPQIFRRLRTQ